jgi:hypothetical protein
VDGEGNSDEFMTPVYALTSTRACGKDSLFRNFRSLDPRFARWAFADELKMDLRPLIHQQFGFDIMDCTNEQKELVRGVLIAYGMAWRAVDPLHWVRKVVASVNQNLINTPDLIPCVTDVRFENEAQHLRDHFGERLVLINLTREGSPPPTDEEEKHFRKVAAMAAFHLHWGNDTLEQQLNHARRIVELVSLA